MNKIVEMEKLVDEVMQAPPSISGLDEVIRQRAYELYELRGREDGHDLDDWLQAELELTRRKAAVA